MCHWGVWIVFAGETGETLPLDFVEIHQPVRHLKK